MAGSFWAASVTAETDGSLSKPTRQLPVGYKEPFFYVVDFMERHVGIKAIYHLRSLTVS
jgi:hypothetical protein